MSRRTTAVILAALCGTHLLLSLLLTRGHVFDKYPDAAALFSQGRLAADERTDFSPIYLLANVALPPGVLRWLQPFAFASAIVAVFLYVRRRRNEWWALFGAALTALSGTAIVYGAVLEPDIWIAAVLAWLLLLTDPRAESRRSWVELAVVGLLAGVAVALRPSNVLWAAPLLALRIVRPGVRKIGPSLVAIALAIFAAVLPARIIQSRSSDPSATMSVGAVLHMGNRPESPGIGANPPLLMKLYELQRASRDRPDYVHALYRQFARSEAGTGESGQLELWWIKKTFAFFSHEPAGALLLVIRKATFFWLAPDAHDLTDARKLDASFPIPLVPTSLLAILALLGLVSTLRSKEDRAVPLAAVALFVSCVVFYVVARYRLAAIPAFAILAASAFPEKAPRRTWLLGAGAFGAAALALSLLLPWLRDARSILRRAEVATLEGNQLDQARRAGKLQVATEHYANALAAQPAIAMVRNLRGVPFESPKLALLAAQESGDEFGLDSPVDLFVGAQLAARGGRCDVALQAADAAASAHVAWAVFDMLQEPRLSTVRCLIGSGQLDKALSEIREVKSVRPGAAEALAAEIALLDATGQQTSAERSDSFSELSALHDPLSVLYALARWHNEVGAGELAAQDAKALIEKLPDAAVGHYELGRALALTKQNEAAVAEYGQALQLAPMLPFPTAPFAEAVNAALAANPDAVTLSTAAEHAFRAGDVNMARTLAERASALFGAAAPAWHQERVRTYAEATPLGT